MVALLKYHTSKKDMELCMRFLNSLLFLIWENHIFIVKYYFRRILEACPSVEVFSIELFIDQWNGVNFPKFPVHQQHDPPEFLSSFLSQYRHRIRYVKYSLNHIFKSYETPILHAGRLLCVIFKTIFIIFLS